MYYPKDVIDEVRMGNDIVDVIGGYVKLNKKGSSYMGLCPFHKEKTPSFSVSQDNQFYHCFGCGASGNVIGFVMQQENYSFIDAIKHLADRINYTLPESTYNPENVKKNEIKHKLYEIHKKAARYYYEQLQSNNGVNASRYLDERGVTPPARNKFGLGYSPIAKGFLFDKLLAEGYDIELILKSGLVYKKDNGEYVDKFYNRLMFPIIDIYGNIIGFGGRILGKGEPKYLNSPETDIFSKSRNLYNLNQARLAKSQNKELILVEGYMDVISIYQAGFKNVVAALGTAFNERHAKAMRPYADSVILLFDSDDAGIKAVLRAIPVLINAGIKVKVLQVTNAKDPDEYIKKFGANAFGKLLTTAKSHILFQVEVLQSKYNLDIIEENVTFTNEVAKLLATIDNAIELDAYIKRAATMTDISVNAIRSEIAKINNVDGFEKVVVNTYKPKRYDTQKQGKGIDEARKSLINLIATNRLVYDKLKGYFNSDEFVDAFYIKLIDIISQLYEQNKPIYTADIVSFFENLEEQQRVSNIFLLQMKFDDTVELEKAVNDQLKLVKEAYITNKMLNVTDASQLQQLINDKKNVDKLHITLLDG